MTSRPYRTFFLVAALTSGTFAQSFTMSTVAGSARLRDGSPGNTAPLRYPYGVAQDASGNVFFADTSDNRVRRVGVNGVITTIAGSGVAGFSGDGGLAINAKLDAPQGIRLDGAGNLYIADYNNNRIRKVVLSSGLITTVAGGGKSAFSGDQGPATQAGLDPYDVAVDSTGNLYIADYLNSRIRKVAAADGTITTIAGIGVPGNNSNVPENQSAIAGPVGISVDSQGRVYFVDSFNNVVKKIDQAANLVTTIAGNGNFGDGEPPDDGDGGKATDTFLVLPFSTAVEPNGDLLIACALELWRVTMADGKIHFIAGSDSLGFAGDGGSPTAAKYAVLYYVASASNGDIVVSDLGNARIRRIHAGVVNTVAGTSVVDNVSATTAFLNFPAGVAPDGKGGFLIADTGNSRVRAVSAGGSISGIAGSGYRGSAQGQLRYPNGVAVSPKGDVFIADSANNRIVRVSSGGAPVAVAGGNGHGFGGDGGSAVLGKLANPTAVAVDALGNLYIADSDNFRIRMVDTNGTITTIAGTGMLVSTGDGGPATKANLTVSDLTLDGAANLYFADVFNGRIRKINLSTNTITTVVGIGTAGYSPNGTSAFSAQLFLPTGVALDSAGNIYIADWGNSVVREVSGGVINTIAGNRTSVFNTESGTAIGVSIDPMGVRVDTDGTVYIADAFNDRIRKLTKAVPTTVTISSGNNTAALPGATLHIAVKVTDAANSPVGNVVVNFNVVSGAATLSTPSAQTDASGIASMQVVLGATQGTVQIAATSTGLSAATFSLTVNPPPVTTPQPQINTTSGVKGAGISTPPILALSTGGIAAVFGQNFGAGAVFQKVGASDLVNGQVPVNFHGICVEMSGTRALIFGASDTQINLQTPNVGSSGSVNVQVITGCDTNNSARSNIVSVPVQAVTPEFFYFAINSNGVNPVAATDSLTATPVVVSSLFPSTGWVPAHSGEIVTVYATGFGDTNPPVVPGTFAVGAARVTGDVKVTLGGRELPAANVIYAGITPQSPGLYQVNLQLPDDTPNGDLPLVITIGGVQSAAGAYLTVQSSN